MYILYIYIYKYSGRCSQIASRLFDHGCFTLLYVNGFIPFCCSGACRCWVEEIPLLRWLLTLLNTQNIRHRMEHQEGSVSLEFCWKTISTKRPLTSDIAKTLYVLGYFFSSIVKVNILLQKLWEWGIGWDEFVHLDLLDIWQRWRSELRLLSDKHISCRHFDQSFMSAKLSCMASLTLRRKLIHVLCTFTRKTDNNVRVSIVMFKTRIAPWNDQWSPRLELCGALTISSPFSSAKYCWPWLRNIRLDRQHCCPQLVKWRSSQI